MRGSQILWIARRKRRYFAAISPPSSCLNWSKSTCMPLRKVLQWRVSADMATASAISSSVAPAWRADWFRPDAVVAGDLGGDGERDQRFYFRRKRRLLAELDRLEFGPGAGDAGFGKELDEAGDPAERRFDVLVGCLGRSRVVGERRQRRRQQRTAEEGGDGSAAAAATVRVWLASMDIPP